MWNNKIPAFPCEEYDGMSLRDYFAAKALQAMLGNTNKTDHRCGSGGLEIYPKYAYEWADAMLKARSA